MRKPALNASAAAELPRKCAKMLSRTRPAMRLSSTPTAIVPAVVRAWSRSCWRSAGARLDARFVAVLFGCDFGQVTSDARSIPTASGA